jgi:hypothetical protein
MAATHAALEDRIALFVAEALPYRELTVAVSRADVRRLARVIEQLNRETPDDPLDSGDDGDLAVTLVGCALTGMAEVEAGAGVWADIDGSCGPLPRRVRAPWRSRLRYAWQAALRTWRAA